jgi:hypothetical protein
MHCLGRLLLGALLAALVTAAGPARAAGPDPEFADAAALPPRGTRVKVLAAGAGMTLGFYGTALGASYLWDGDPGAADLRIPVAGPWMKLGQTRLCDDLEDDGNCSDVLQVFGAVLAGFDGLGQLAGLALLTEGVFLRESRGRAARAGLGGWRAETHTPNYDPLLSFRLAGTRMRPVPLAGARGLVGLGVVGVF